MRMTSASFFLLYRANKEGGLHDGVDFAKMKSFFGFEAHFHLGGWSIQNCRIWGSENPCGSVLLKEANVPIASDCLVRIEERKLH